MKQKKIDLYDDGIGCVEYVNHMGDDLTIVNSARVSFGVEKDELDDKDKKLINYLIKHKHTSTMEHCTVTFRFTVPLFIRSQHHRHRTWCLAGDTEVTFNRPDRWKRGQHCKQTGNKGAKFTMERLYQLWNDPIHHKKIKNMLIRVYDEKNKVFTVANLADVMHSGKKQLFQATLENGKKIKCSKDHRILTKEGWQTLEKAIGLELSSNGTATMSKDSEFLTNGTGLLWRSYDWMKSQRELGLSVSEIAANAGCSYHNIRKWLKIHDLQFDQILALQEYNKKNGVWNKNKKGYMLKRKPLSKKALYSIREARSGANSNWWKGGITSDRSNIARWTTEQASKIHEINNYTCQECNTSGGKLQVHHIKSVVEYPELARDLNNLITICRPCHFKIHHGKEMARSKKGSPLAGIYSKVIKVEALGVEETYDLSIEGDNHNFIASGIVVHNSYNEISRRYTEFGLQFYEPEAFRSQHASNRQASTDDLIDPKVHYYDINNRTTQRDGASLAIKNHHAVSLELFNDLIKAGVCREQARGVLPQNLYTQYYGTANLGNLLKFINLRIHEGAQWEIQQVAKAVLKILEELYPISVAAYQNNLKGEE